MTLAKRKAFIREMTADIRKHVLDLAEKLPDTWDGVEIRQWIADYVKEKYTFPNILIGRRAKDYENEILVRNL